MKQILVQLRQDSSLREQLSEIWQAWDTGRYSNLLFHIYSGIPDEERLVQLTQELRSCCEKALIVGTMSGGEIKDGRLMSQGILISGMLFESTDIQVLRFDDAKQHEVETGRRICEALNGIDQLKAAELLLPGTDLNTRVMFEEIGRCREGIHIFGGYTGGHQLNTPQHFVFDISGTLYNSVLAITYAGEDFHINVDKSIGWEALGMPFKVTKADGNRLIELDGKPAAEVYKKFLQIDRYDHNNAEEAFEFPLLAKHNGEERLRSTAYIDEDGSLLLHGFVTEGMDIHLSYGNPSNIVEKVNRRLEDICRFQPQTVLLYSCVVRKTFWEDFVDMEMIPFASVASTAGFHTWGEVLRDMRTGEVVEHNITLLSIAMREGPASSTQPQTVKVDDSVLRGQASLLKRLTKLVYATTEELQKAYNDLNVLNKQLTVMAEHDALTGLYNRGRIEALINEALDRSAANGEKVSLVMADLDHFKDVNDTYGHAVGDAVLRELADILQGSIWGLENAQAGRWGGEEFFVLLPGMDEAQALAYAERLRRQVEERAFPGVNRQTISMGLLTVVGTEDHQHIYTRVDDALYQAKDGGRNRVVQCK